MRYEPTRREVWLKTLMLLMLAVAGAKAATSWDHINRNALLGGLFIWFVFAGGIWLFYFYKKQNFKAQNGL